MLRRGWKSRAQTASLSRYRNEPVAFCREVLGVEPWERQQQIMRSVADRARTTVRACHYSGKTWAAGCLAHWWVRCFEPALVISTAPTDRQVKEVLWKEIRARHHQAALPGSLNRQDLTVSPTQRAFGFTTSEPEKFQGWHEANILVIVDEASGVEEPIYEAIEGVLTGPNARLLLIGNPNNPGGTFYESFRSPLYEGGCFHIRATDVPETLLPPGWKTERLAEWGEESPIYQVRVMGNFPSQGEGSLIALAWVEAARQRESEPEPEQPIEIGVDMAAEGGDECVLYARQGQKVIAWDYWRNPDTMQSAGRIAAKARELGAKVVKVDDIGIGKGTCDQLRHVLSGDGITVTGVNVGEAATDKERFFNRRSEIFWGLADRFKAGEVDIPALDDLLLDQLTQLRYTFTPRGQTKLESKADLKKRRAATSRWQSPDRADALALCFSTAGNRYVAVSLQGGPAFEPKRLW